MALDNYRIFESTKQVITEKFTFDILKFRESTSTRQKPKAEIDGGRIASRILHGNWRTEISERCNWSRSYHWYERNWLENRALNIILKTTETFSNKIQMHVLIRWEDHAVDGQWLPAGFIWRYAKMDDNALHFAYAVVRNFMNIKSLTPVNAKLLFS